ncbi:MAG: hypothetical protein AAF901_13650, partial [Bacteroidota bacterium]
ITLNLEQNLRDQFKTIIEADDFDSASGYAFDKIKCIEFPDGIEFYQRHNQMHYQNHRLQ